MKNLGAIVAVVAATTGTGCMVEIDQLANPESHFRAALDEAARYQGRSGPARELNVPAYDPSDREI